MSRLGCVVCIGRFQPPTACHLECIEAALARADEVRVVVGGGAQPRSAPSPWLAEERAAMIRACLPAAGGRLSVVTLRDISYDDARWAATLRARIAVHPGKSTGLMACGRHDTAHYAALFPDWMPVAPPKPCAAEEDFAITLFDAGVLSPALASRLPEPLRALVARDMSTAGFRELTAEWAHIREYRDAWRAAPFPPIHVTVDAIVTHRGAVLLIERGRRPGRGLHALPGGFLDPGETLLASALRELAEETGIALAPKILTDALVANRVFDAPHRSLRGRTITHAFHFDLPADLERPLVAGGDDAAAARWAPFGAVDSREMFEDHYAILQVMIGLA